MVESICISAYSKMNRDTDASADIVWPDEEHLFDVDTLSMDERAGSQTSDGWNGLRGATETKANESGKSELPSHLSSPNEYWDHDDRNVDAGGLRQVCCPVLCLCPGCLAACC